MIHSRPTITKLFSTLLLLVLVILCFFPFYWALVSSLKNEQAIFQAPPQWIPLKPSLVNYNDLLQKTKTLRWTINSFIVSLLCVALVCFLSSLAGYAFSKIDFKAKKVFFGVIITTMLLPKYVMLVPLFQLVSALQWFNTYQGMIIPEVASALPFGIFLIRQFIATQPHEVFESATIDGCNEIRLYANIAVPLAKPAIASLAILIFVRSWNDYMWQLIVVSKDTMKTLPLGLASLQTENVTLYGEILAAAMIAAFPLILVFIFFQRYFVSGLSSGAVKG